MDEPRPQALGRAPLSPEAGLTPYPESETCGKCGAHTSFKWDDEEQDWTSVCCTWSAQRLDVEAPDA